MSPATVSRPCPVSCGPRASGDEPFSTEKFMIGSGVVPARAGMSPKNAASRVSTNSGPRASGDEPWMQGTEKVRCEWSPRERG